MEELDGEKYDEQGELKKLLVEKNTFEREISKQRSRIIQDLIDNGLGNEIKQTINKPLTFTKWQLFRIKFKLFFQKLFEVL